MQKLFLVSLFLASFIKLLGQDVSFYKENITMKINEKSFYVTGIYYLKSSTSETGTLLYPFPEDTKYGAVDSIYIYNITTSEIINPLEVKSDYLVFNIDFSKKKDLKIQIAYRQIIKSTRAEYILKTTINWKNPLQNANYQLIVPSNIKVNRFSIQPQDSIITKNEVIYYWKESNYMPDNNFIFDFIVE